VQLYSQNTKVSDLTAEQFNLLNTDAKNGVEKIKEGSQTNLLVVMKDPSVEKHAQMQLLVRLLISYADSDVYIKNYNDSTYIENVNLAIRIMLNHAWSMLGVLNDSAGDVYSPVLQMKLKNATSKFEEINKEGLETTMGFDDSVTVNDIGKLWKLLQTRLLAWNKEFLSYNIHPDKYHPEDMPERNLIVLMYEIINDDVTKMMLVQRIKQFNNYISELGDLADEFKGEKELPTVLKNGMLQLKNVAKVNLNSVEVFHPKAKQTHWYNDAMRHIKKTGKNTAATLEQIYQIDNTNTQELVRTYMNAIKYSREKCVEALSKYMK